MIRHAEWELRLVHSKHSFGLSSFHIHRLQLRCDHGDFLSKGAWSLTHTGARWHRDLSGNIAARVVRLLPNGAHLEVHFDLDSCCSENVPCVGRIFLSNINCRSSDRRRATRRPSHSNRPWTQIDDIANNYHWWAHFQNRFSYWSTPRLQCSLVCTKLSLRFRGFSKRMIWCRSGCDNQCSPTS